MKHRHSRRTFLAQSTAAGVGALACHPFAAFGQALEAAVDRADLASRASQLKITDVKCGFIRGGASLFVKIHTNQGIWGCGEGVDAVRGTYHMVNGIGRLLRDCNPLDVHRIFEELRRGGVFGGAQSGMYVAVLSAIETALWDLAGKALALPVYQLLGGKFPK
jgi:galactonate dehydratase